MKKMLPILLLISCSFSLFAQNNQWTWISGDSTVNVKSVFGIRGVPASANNPGSRYGEVSWTDASGSFWLFGGDASSINGSMNDLWKYLPSTNQWTWMGGDTIPGQLGVYGTKGVAAADNKSPGRNFAVGWTDASGNLWLFGGQTYTASGEGSLNDLWRYNISTGLWTWMSGDNIINPPPVYGTKSVSAPANTPGAKFGAVTWTDLSGNLWLFGGNSVLATANGFINDLWKYSPSTGQWTWVSGDNTPLASGVYGIKGVAAATNKPGARYQPFSWTDASGNLWLFGGQTYSASGTGSLNDLWKYTPSAGQWTWVSGDSITYVRSVYGAKGIPAPTNKPGGRAYGFSWRDALGNLWLWGGSNSFTYINELWKYIPSTGMWTWEGGDSTLTFQNEQGIYGTKGIAAPANKPGARSGSNNWTDASGNLWLFGGSGYATTANGYLNDLWKYTLSGTTVTGPLGSFTGHRQEQSIVLSWTSTREQNLSAFVVERYAGGQRYDSIGTVAASGLVSSTGSYSFVDRNPGPGTTIYRLRQMDQQGGILSSATTSVAIAETARFAVIQNPVPGSLQIMVQLPAAQKVTIQISDMNGHLLMQQERMGDRGGSVFSVPVGRLSKGNYIIHVQSDNMNGSKIFVKQ